MRGSHISYLCARRFGNFDWPCWFPGRSFSILLCLFYLGSCLKVGVFAKWVKCPNQSVCFANRHFSLRFCIFGHWMKCLNQIFFLFDFVFGKYFSFFWRYYIVWINLFGFFHFVFLRPYPRFFLSNFQSSVWFLRKWVFQIWDLLNKYSNPKEWMSGDITINCLSGGFFSIATFWFFTQSLKTWKNEVQVRCLCLFLFSFNPQFPKKSNSALCYFHCHAYLVDAAKI